MLAHSIPRLDAQSARSEPDEEFLATYRGSASADESLITLVGHVVMVEVEGTRRDVVGFCERVEFLQRRVADQVRPQHAVGGPLRGIDQDRHRMIVGTVADVGTAPNPIRAAQQ